VTCSKSYSSSSTKSYTKTIAYDGRNVNPLFPGVFKALVTRVISAYSFEMKSIFLLSNFKF